MFTKYLLLTLVAAMTGLLTWLGGGTIASWLNPWCFWFSLIILEVLIVFPEPKRNESLFDARNRVWAKLIRDPILYIGGILLIFLTVQWLNCCVQTAAELTKTNGFLPPPPVSWLPWSIVGNEARTVLDWFFPAYVCLLAVRNGLLKPTKRFLGAFFIWNASAIAILGAVQFLTDSQFLFFGKAIRAQVYATFGYPNHAAGFFAFMLTLSIGYWFWTFEHQERHKLPHYVYLFPIFCNASGAMLSGSRAGFIFTGAIFAGSILLLAIRYWMSWQNRIRVAMASIIVALTLLGVYCFIFLQTPVINELRSTDWSTFLNNPIASRSGYQGDAAMKMFKEYPLYGVGSWGYRWLVMSKDVTGNFRFIEPEQQGNARGIGQGNVHNDLLQFAAENGSIGAGLMLACCMVLSTSLLFTLFKSHANTMTDIQADKSYLNRLNIMVYFILFATLLLAVHSIVDIPFRSPACLIAWLLAFAIAPGFVLKKPITLLKGGTNA